VLALAGCGFSPPEQSVVGVQPQGKPVELATGLEAPWSVIRLASGSALISERDTGLIKEYTSDGSVREVGTIDGVVAEGEGGLLGLAVSEAEDGWLYAYLTAASDNRVVRVALEGRPGSYTLGAASPVFTGLPKAGNHNGGRIAFGPDGALYLTVGDAGNREGAQDVDYLGGKLLRINADGTVPADNPFAGSPVYSLGHRNPQGIAWDDEGQLFAAEFGQDTWDEFNSIEPGANYGWPVVEGVAGNPDYVDPVLQWATDDASPSGLAYINDTFFMASLRGERVWVIYLDREQADSVTWFQGEHGRIRDVTEGPDGSLWLLTNNTDGRGAPREGDDRLIQYRLGELVEG
jgi:glucose/arabinose dehydrogenase